MKSTLYCLLALILITSCSSPKYAYNFDTYDYNSGKTNHDVKIVDNQSNSLLAAPEILLASRESNILLPAGKSKVESPITVKKTYAQMSKSERKDFRSDLKKYIKEKKESVKAAKKTNAMDNDLKLAAIFGAVGLVALIISGDVFYILGGIALIIGVVFFVKWLVRQ